jgi:putative membrane protein
MKIIISILANTLAIFLVSHVITDVQIDGVMAAFTVAIVLGILNTFLKPVLHLLTLPINIITLGLFSFVINIFLLYLTDYLVKGFEIQSIISAILFSFFVSIISSALSKI